MKQTYTLALCLLSFCTLAQKRVAGIVRDALTLETIAHCNIITCSGLTGTLSNAEGYFELSISKNCNSDTIIISSLGFESKAISLNQFTLDTLKIDLQPRSMQMGSVLITTSRRSAADIVKKSLQQVDNNLLKDQYLMNGFYREYLKENNNYGRLVEAAVNVRNNPSKKQFIHCSEDVIINQIRKSRDMTSCFPNFKRINHLNELLVWNPIRYHRQAFHNLGKFSFSLDSVISFNNSSVYVISYSSGERNSGTLYIDSNDYTILKCTRSIKSLNEVIKLDNGQGIYWQDRTITVIYRKFNGKIYPQYLSYCFGITLLSNEGHRQCMLSIQNELILKDILLEDNTNEFSKMDKSQDLYIQQFPYDSLSWGNFPSYPLTTLQKQVEADLNK